MNEIHLAVLVTCSVVAIVLFFVFMIHQEVLFGRMIKQNEKVMRASNDRLNKLVDQNNTLLIHADERLDRANQMVLTLAHSADLLAGSVSELKEMMVHLEQVYVSRNEQILKNRDEYKAAYDKLLIQFEDQRARLRTLADEDHRALKELARRPTMNTTNNNS